MARELGPARKLARHRGDFLEGRTGLRRARQQGLSGVVHEQRDEAHAARQAHGRARPDLQAEGRAFTRLARRARSKARARASSVSFGQAPAWVAVASAVEPAPRRQLRARRSSPLRDGPDGAAGPDKREVCSGRAAKGVAADAGVSARAPE